MAKGIAENKMGYVPVNQLLISMSVPMMISMLVQALYNVVDSVFVSYIGENALTAVSLAFPVQNLMIAIAVGTSVGVNALLSKALEKRIKRQPIELPKMACFSPYWVPLYFGIWSLFFL